MDYKSATTAADAPPSAVTAASRYESLATERQPYLERARECSRLTIPSLLPPEGHPGSTALYRPFQSTGADGVNNLAAKLLMTLFPPGAPFFRLSIDDFVVEELQQGSSNEDARGEFEKVLGKIEKSVVRRMEAKGARKVNFEAILHLIVAGNGLQYVKKDGGLKFFPIDRYVVSRDLDDNVLEIVVKECIARDALPALIREVVDRHSKSSGSAPSTSAQRDVEVYTWVQRDADGDGSWKVHQEVCGEVVPGSDGTYPKDTSAWIPLRWTKIAGEAYGRGRCEEYLGDLYSLDAITKAIVQFAAAASKVLCLVDESGTTDKQEVAEAESGAVIDGDARNISFLQLDKQQDFQVAHSVAAETTSRLDRGFLSAASIQRNAERVTAEEIRLMAGELEQGLGGTYSVLGEEWQRPLVARELHILSQDKKSRVPKLPKGTVSPQIVTGLDGLGRNTDMTRLDALIQGVAAQFGPEAVKENVNVGAYMARRGAALGIDMTGLIKSQQEVQQAAQQQQMQGMAAKLGGPAIKAVSDNMIDVRNQQQQQTPPTNE
jgi:hypothetical protein